MIACVCLAWRDRRRRHQGAAARLEHTRVWRSRPDPIERALELAIGMRSSRDPFVWIEAPGAPATLLKVNHP